MKNLVFFVLIALVVIVAPVSAQTLVITREVTDDTRGRILATGQEMVDLEVLNFSVNEEITLEKITFRVESPDQEAWSDLNKVYLFIGDNNIIPEGTYLSRGDVILTGLSLTFRESIQLKVKADLNNSGYSAPGSIFRIQLKSLSANDLEV